MTFIKKNLLFCVIVAICLAAFCGGVFFALTQSGDAKKAQNSLKSVESQLSALLRASPSPTAANLEAAESNLAELKSALSEIREDLQRGSSFVTSEDGVSVIAGIQQYISSFQKATAAHRDENDEPARIAIPSDFAFGFKKYLNIADIPEDGTKISLLDKQRQVLSYLLTQLIAAGPQSIDAVNRELIETNNKEVTFLIDEEISARVPGAIDTMAFSITFSSYTDTLRDFLNSLSSFELPIVVRSIEVKRPSGSETVVKPTRRKGKDAGNIFEGLFGGVDANDSVEPTENKPVPVIEENVSQFTVILEFIEVVLPSSNNKEVTSDSA